MLFAHDLQPYQYIRLQSRLVEGQDQPRRPWRSARLTALCDIDTDSSPVSIVVSAPTRVSWAHQAMHAAADRMRCPVAPRPDARERCA